MELRDYWRVFKRRAWIPLVLAMAAVLTASAVVYLSKPTYTATATVAATGTSSNGGSAAAVVSFPQAVTSNTVAVGVIQKLGLIESVDQLIKRIRVTLVGSNLYQVIVTDANPARAAAVSNEVARQAAALYLQLSPQTTNSAGDAGLAKARDDLRQQYVAAITARVNFQLKHPTAAASRDVSLVTQAIELQLEEDAAAAAYRGVLDRLTSERVAQIEAATGFDARIVDQAVARPATGGRVVELLAAGALALLAGAGLVFLLEYLDTAVREPEGAEEMVGAPVIGVIPRATARSLRAVKARRS
jgi:capsular polysaccharide biosynthesis protein